MNPMRLLLPGFAFLSASLAHGQMMRLTGFSTYVEADFYSYNVEHTDWEETGGYIQHHRRPVAGTMTFEAQVDFTSPQVTFSGFTFTGDVEGTGPFAFNLGGDLTIEQLPSGLWSFQFLPPFFTDYFLETGFVLDPSRQFQEPIYMSIRSYPGIGQSVGDTSLWPIFEVVQLTPIPEPASTAFFGVSMLVSVMIFKRWSRIHRDAMVRSKVRAAATVSRFRREWLHIV